MENVFSVYGYLSVGDVITRPMPGSISRQFYYIHRQADDTRDLSVDELSRIVRAKFGFRIKSLKCHTIK